MSVLQIKNHEGVLRKIQVSAECSDRLSGFDNLT